MVKRVFYLILLVLGFSFLLTGCDLKEYYELLEMIDTEEEPETGYYEETDEYKKDQQTTGETFSKEIVNETYADNYAYRTLNATAQQVYDEILTTILKHKEKVEVSTTDVGVLEQAYSAVCGDYGGLYWVTGYAYTQYTSGGKVISMDFMPQYTMGYEEREKIQRQIDASVEELLAGISISDSDYDKAKYVFEVLVSNVEYDASVENNQNIVSVFLDRASVCQGYACGTQYLLRLLGIQSAIVTGSAKGESHAWNLIRLDGNYYYMDTTWGDSGYLDISSQGEDYINYNYLAVTSEEIGRTHRIENSFELPECTSVENNYFIRENRYFSQWDPKKAGAVLAEVWNTGGSEVSIKFSSLELYETALNYFITEQHIADYCENITSISYVEDRELYVLTFHFS